MSQTFRVQKLIDQNAESVVERVVAEDGGEFLRTRLKLAPEVLAGLFGEGVFEGALAKLKGLEHRDLREVCDGGMSEEDGVPWVTSRWVEGEVISEQDLKEKDIRRLGRQCHALVEDLGEWARAVDFDPARILSVRTYDGGVQARFMIDYACWFRDEAAGVVPGTGRSAAAGVRKLLEGLVIKQLKIPSKPISERVSAPIPLVDERSPALRAYQVPRTQRVMSILLWIGFLLTLGVITGLTLVGMKRMEENPRSAEAPMRL